MVSAEDGRRKQRNNSVFATVVIKLDDQLLTTVKSTFVWTE